jgi:hypothetical protein
MSNIVCKKCNAEVPERFAVNGMCLECAIKEEEGTPKQNG